MELDNKKTIEEVIKILIDCKNTLVPCSMSEVIELEKAYQITLPDIYKKFLLSMGKDAGKYMLGNSCFYNEIYDLQQGAREIIVDNGLPELPVNSFVFWIHQGYQFAFFLVGESQNPPVYYFSEGQGMKNFRLINKSLTDFFYDQLLVSGIG